MVAEYWLKVGCEEPVVVIQQANNMGKEVLWLRLSICIKGLAKRESYLIESICWPLSLEVVFEP